MSKLLKIGIVGCGAIGGSLAKAIAQDFKKQAQLVALYDIDQSKSQGLSLLVAKTKKLAVEDLKELLRKSELVIEATKAEAAFGIAKKALAHQRNIMLMSVGGILKHYRQLRLLALKNKASVFIPSGAICGVDGLKAAVYGKIKKVILTTRKPAKAFLGVGYLAEKGISLEGITADTVIFAGNAEVATKAFPQNINVAATLSLAGIGPQNTMVRIVASPSLNQNVHEIEIESEAGKIFTRTENVIHPDNPKTSYLAVLSAIATLKQILEPIKIGT